METPVGAAPTAAPGPHPDVEAPAPQPLAPTAGHVVEPQGDAPDPAEAPGPAIATAAAEARPRAPPLMKLPGMFNLSDPAIFMTSATSGWLMTAFCAVLAYVRLRFGVVSWLTVPMPSIAASCFHGGVNFWLIVFNREMKLEDFPPAPYPEEGQEAMSEWAQMRADAFATRVVRRLCALIDNVALIITKLVITSQAIRVADHGAEWGSFSKMCTALWVATGTTAAIRFNAFIHCRGDVSNVQRKNLFSSQDIFSVFVFVLAQKLDGAGVTWLAVGAVPWVLYLLLVAFASRAMAPGLLHPRYVHAHNLRLAEQLYRGGFLGITAGAAPVVAASVYLAVALDRPNGASMADLEGVLLTSAFGLVMMWAMAFPLVCGMRALSRHARQHAPPRPRPLAPGPEDVSPEELVRRAEHSRRDAVDAMSDDEVREACRQLALGQDFPELILQVGETLFRAALSRARQSCSLGEGVAARFNDTFEAEGEPRKGAAGPDATGEVCIQPVS